MLSCHVFTFLFFLVKVLVFTCFDFINFLNSTNFLDFNVSNNKQSKLVNVNLLNVGDTNVYCNVNTNNKINYDNKIPLPYQGIGLHWSEITTTWNQTRKLWRGATYSYNNVKVPRGGLGRSLCISFSVETKNLKEFKLYGCSLLFEVLSY